MRTAAWGAFASAILVVASARADATSDANGLFARGRQLFLEERYEEALKALEESDRLATSPNTTLLAGRCLDKLGRRERAVRKFDDAAAAARARVTAGEPRYRPTLDAAVTERERLKADMGTLLVQTAPARAGAEVVTPHVEATTDGRGEAEIAHRAGHFTVTIRGGGGPEETREVTIETGKRITLRVGEPESPGPTPAPPGSDWMLPAGIVGASLGALSMGVGIVLWTQAERVHSDLEAECRPRCTTDAQRAEANDGETFMSAGNVAFVTGAVVGAIGGALLITRASRGSADGVAVRVAPGVGGFRATVSFAPE